MILLFGNTEIKNTISIKMEQYSKEQLDVIWAKGIIVEGWKPEMVRKDAAGAWMLRDKYGDHDSIFGWDVDHIYPQKKLQDFNVPQSLIDNDVNLRPMQWENNISKSDDYPDYKSVVVAENTTNNKENKYLTVNEQVQKLLQEQYKDYIK